MIKGVLIAFSMAASLMSPDCGGFRLPFSTTSPEGTYKVEFTKRKDAFDYYVVVFSVSKNGQPFLVNEPTGSSEGLTDPLFTDEYPDHVWLSNCTLRLGVKERFAERQDEIRVTNDTRRVLSYVRVDTRDKYLVFDLQPGATITLPAYDPPVRGVETKYLAVFATFDDGEQLPQKFASFDIRNAGDAPAHFYVSITGEGTTITSRELKPYDRDAR